MKECRVYKLPEVTQFYLFIMHDADLYCIPFRLMDKPLDFSCGGCRIHKVTIRPSPHFSLNSFTRKIVV